MGQSSPELEGKICGANNYTAISGAQDVVELL
jgi:hypothetical protein